MSDDWNFHEEDEDKLPFWTMQWKESEDAVLVVWPTINSDGSVTFSYGHAYNDDYYYEFEFIGNRKYLDQAKQACEEWGQKNSPEDL